MSERREEASQAGGAAGRVSRPGATSHPSTEEFFRTNKLIRPIRAEDPHGGSHGQLEVVRKSGRSTFRQFNRDTGEWEDVGPPELRAETATAIGTDVSGSSRIPISAEGVAGMPWRHITLDNLKKEVAVAVTRIRTLSVAAGDDTTDWQEMDDALDSDIYITAVSFATDVTSSPFQSSEHVLRLAVAVGADGSESEISEMLPLSIGASVNTAPPSGFFPLSPPVRVASGERLTARILDSDGGAVNWASEEPQITVHYYIDNDLAA